MTPTKLYIASSQTNLYANAKSLAKINGYVEDSSTSIPNPSYMVLNTTRKIISYTNKAPDSSDSTSTTITLISDVVSSVKINISNTSTAAYQEQWYVPPEDHYQIT